MNSTAILTHLVEASINRYLALDPEISGQLGELQGKIIGFNVSAPEFSIYVLPEAEKISLQAASDIVPDCVISGSALSLLKMMRSDEPTRLLNSGEIEITGESRIAQRFSDILKEVEIDWEEMLSKVMGDFAAHRIGSQVTHAQHWLSQTLESLRMDSTEYLQEESGILPTPIELAHFADETEKFRSDVDRLEARIKRLEKKLKAKMDTSS